MRIDIPTATPAMIRELTKTVKSVATADITADPPNKRPVKMSTFLRPNRSPRNPATALPAKAPHPRQLTAQPSFRSPEVPVRLKYDLIKGTTPEITVASKPSRKPPIATVRATAATYKLLDFNIVTTESSTDAPCCKIFVDSPCML